MGSYRTLEVWQLSRVLTADIYRLSATFPKSETYSLQQQMRRAAVSIMSNLAEGQGRWSPRDQCNFYWIARGSLHEVESQLFIASDLAYITKPDLDRELRLTEKIAAKLNALIESVLNRRPVAGGRRP